MTRKGRYLGILVLLVFSIVFASAGIPTNAPTNGLMGYWSFDNNNANDDSGNARHLTESGSLSYVSGKDGNAADFNGATLTSTSPFFSSVNPYSVTLWVNPDADGGYLANFRGNCSGVSRLAYESGNDISWFAATVNNADPLRRVNNAVPLNQWTHVAVTWDGTLSPPNIYLNGVAQQGIIKTGSSSLHSDPSCPFRIGSREGTSSYFNGKIDEVAFYDRVLSAAEVQTLYGQGGGQPAPTCSDGIQNQGETGVDCGGPCAACQATPTCSDGIQNQGETGIDCGGPCSACPIIPICGDGTCNGAETCSICSQDCGVCSPTPTLGIVNVNPSITHQTFTGWEAVTYAMNDHAGYFTWRPDIIRITADAGITRVRLEIKAYTERPTDVWDQTWGPNGCMDPVTPNYNSACYNTWSDDLRANAVNDNNDPFTIDPTGFHFSGLDDVMNNVVIPLRNELASRGEQLEINLNYVGFGDQELSNSPVYRQNPEEYAELMLATFNHFQSTYGFVPDDVEVILEPDLFAANWNAQQVGQATAAAGARLEAAGYTPDFIVPSVTTAANAVSYFDTIMQVPGAAGYVKELSYHRYGGSTSDIQNIGARAKQHNIGASMTEWWKKDSLNSRVLAEDLILGRNTAWQQGTLAADINQGSTAITEIDTTTNTVTLGATTKILQQYYKYIRPGATMIDATSTDNNVEPVAFINSDGKYAVVVRTVFSGTYTVGGLPAGTYERSYATANEHDQQLSDVTIAAGQVVSVPIPSAGVFSIVSKTGGAQPPTATCSDGIQNQGETGIDCGGPCSACAPTILDYSVGFSTFWGGSVFDDTRNMVQDSQGNYIFSGYTSSNLPNSHKIGPTGDQDAWIAKFDSNGNHLWTTEVGGTGKDYIINIEIDPNDDTIYIGGQTGSTNFPTTTGAFDTTHNGGTGGFYGDTDAFVAKLSADGKNLLFSTFLGGSGNDQARGGVRLDPTDGTIYAFGETFSNNFPNGANSLNSYLGGTTDGFVTKLSADGSQVLWSRYIGGTGTVTHDVVASLDLDSNGDAWIHGMLGGSGLQTTTGAYDTTYNGDVDTFLMKLDKSSGNILYSTYLGGPGYDGTEASSMSVDTQDNIYLMMHTRSTNLPTKNAHQSTLAGGVDHYLLKFDSNMNVQLATYIGGNGAEENHGGVTTDNQGNIYVGGTTKSSNLPTTSNAIQQNLAGSNDGYFHVYSSVGQLLYGTYFGASGSEQIRNVKVDRDGNVLMLGESKSTNYPTTQGAYDTTHAGDFDGVITQFVVSTQPPTPTPTCSDGVQNQGETGVDCGGPCAACAPVAVCGDGVITSPELCDGNNFGGQSCQTLGFDSGTLACTNQCLTIDTSGCSNACKILSVSWDSTIDIEGNDVGFTFNTQNCQDGEVFEARVTEDDGILGSDPVNNNPQDITVTNNVGRGTWNAEWQADQFFTLPEFDLEILLKKDTSERMTSSNQLSVTPLVAPICGDGQINQASEQCDDGNTNDGDGCDSSCLSEIAAPANFEGFISKATSIDAGLELSRTTCEAPCNVHGSASGTTAVGESRIYEKGHHRIDFGDPSSTNTYTNPITGATENTNIGGGPEAAHIYFQPGTYTVTLTSTAWNGQQYFADTDTKTVTVVASTRATRYVDPVSGNDNNDGLTAQTPWKTGSKVKSWMAGGNNREILVKGGTTLTFPSELSITNSNQLYGSYGTGKATLTASSGGAVLNLYANGKDINDIIFRDIIVRNNAQVPNPLIMYAKPQTTYSPTQESGINNFLALNVDFIVTVQGDAITITGKGQKSNFMLMEIFIDQTGSAGRQSIFADKIDYFAVTGSELTGGDSIHAVLDHATYPTDINHGLFQGTHIHHAQDKNFCINTNAASGGFTEYWLINYLKCTHHWNGVDWSNANNNPDVGLFRNVIVQNSLFEDLGVPSQGIGVWGRSVAEHTIRYNTFRNIPQDDVDILGINKKPLYYGNTYSDPSTGTICGDEHIVAPEQCDDGNTQSGDGCSSTCQFEAGPACGDGNIEIGEQCDDGNRNENDGCSSTCQIEVCTFQSANWEKLNVVDGEPANLEFTSAFCNGETLRVTVTEKDPTQTDDVLYTFPVTITGPQTQVALVAPYTEEIPGEQPQLFFTATLLSDPTQSHKSQDLHVAQAICSDGLQGVNEQCDDGNTVSGDGCSSSCQIEIGPVCGDGNIDAGEQCDDSNLANGDGCSSRCSLEKDPAFPGFPIPGLHAQSINPVISLSRTTCEAPCPVQASAFATTVDVSNRPYENLEHRFNFGDPSSDITFYNPVTKKDVHANSQQVGPEAYFRYENPGTYTITYTARGWDGTDFYTATATKDITVLPSSRKTWYFDPVDGDDVHYANECSTPATACKSEQRFREAVEWGDNREILLKRGTKMALTVPVLTIGSNKVIGAWGSETGQKPILTKAKNWAGGVSVLRADSNGNPINNFIIRDIELNNNGHGDIIFSYIKPAPSPGAINHYAFINADMKVTNAGNPITFSGGGPVKGMVVESTDMDANNANGRQGIFAQNVEYFTYIDSEQKGGVGDHILDHGVYGNIIEKAYYAHLHMHNIDKNFCLNLNAAPTGITEYTYVTGVECGPNLNNGFDLSNSYNDVRSWFSQVVIRGNKIHGLGTGGQGNGIMAFSAAETTISHNEFVNNPHTDIRLDSPLIEPQVYNNKFTDRPNTGNVCGDKIIFATEQCDDGNTVSGDGCSSTCTIEGIAQLCSNGIVEGTEQCDDGNRNNNDGCSNVCQIETSYCGDGNVGAGEQCEPPNTANCDANCQDINVQPPAGDECNDGIDNDGDGLIDYIDDLGCYGINDPTEGGNNAVVENGWMVFEPSADTQIIYVSSSQGSDANDGLSQQTPLKTIGAGYAKLRDGYPDWMLLKRGDTWTDESLTGSSGSYWKKGGRSKTQPLIVATYGASTARAELGLSTKAIENRQGWNVNDPTSDNSAVDHFVIKGIRFYAYQRDTSSPTYNPNAGGGNAVDWHPPSTGITFEDNEFAYTGVYFDGGGFNKRINDLTIRRNVIYKAHSATGGRSQGLFMNRVSSALVEENIFYHNGWSELDRVQSATPENHNIYATGNQPLINPDDIQFVNNMFIDGSSTGVQARNGGVVDKNLFSGNAAHLNWGFLTGLSGPTPGGVFGSVINNVMIDSRPVNWQSANGADRAAWGVLIQNVKWGAIANNIVAREFEPGIQVAGIKLSGKQDTAGRIGVNNLDVYDNVVYDYPKGLDVVQPSFSNINIYDNEFTDITGSQVVAFREAVDLTQLNFARNTYHSNSNPTNPFYFRDGPNSGSRTFSEWTNIVGETGASNQPINYPDPDRDLASYHASLGRTATKDAFITEALKQSRFNWDPKYTACEVNNHVRGGFGKALLNCNSGTGTSPPVPPTPTCSDGIQNQGETGIDCGGPCTACAPTITCGNNIVEGTELCDGNAQSCTINGYAGTQSCNAQCTGWNTCIATESCGDGIINGNEECEPASTATCDALCKDIIPPTPDTTPPIITVVSPTQSSIYNSPDVTLEVYTNELAALKYSLDSGTYTAFVSPTTLSGLSDGPHTVIIEATDLAGNVDVKPILFSVISNPTPQPICGNGIIETGEECDDGNTIGRDGCDSTCREKLPEEKYNKFDGPDTTDFELHPYDEIPNPILHRLEKGKIEFLQNVNLRKLAELNLYVFIEDNLAGIDEEALSELNIPARITLEGEWENPQIVKIEKETGSRICEDPECVIESNDGTKVTFRVNKFSNYTVTEDEGSGDSGSGSGSGSGGGGGGGGSSSGGGGGSSSSSSSSSPGRSVSTSSSTPTVPSQDAPTTRGEERTEIVTEILGEEAQQKQSSFSYLLGFYLFLLAIFIIAGVLIWLKHHRKIKEEMKKYAFTTPTKTTRQPSEAPVFSL